MAQRTFNFASGDYPAGAEYAPNAPYNQSSLPEREFTVTVSSTLSKNTTVTTDDYDYDDGDITISDDNLAEAFRYDHYSPESLIKNAKELLEYAVTITRDKGMRDRMKDVIQECAGWTQEDFFICED